MDRQFLTTAFIYGTLGLALGILMAATRNHVQMPAHAHILLLGFVVSMFYAVVHKLWLRKPSVMVSRLQFWLHQIGVIGLAGGLYLLYGGYAARDVLEPILGAASFSALIAFVLMGWLALVKTK